MVFCYGSGKNLFFFILSLNTSEETFFLNQFDFFVIFTYYFFFKYIFMNDSLRITPPEITLGKKNKKTIVYYFTSVIYL